MKSYSALKQIAKFFRICAWTNLVVGIIKAILILITSQERGLSEQPLVMIAFIAGIAILTFIVFVINMAISEFIWLCINVADKIDNIDNNLLFLATKKEEEIK